MSKDQSDNLSVMGAFGQTGFYGKIALILATWFGIGLVPVASGTFGTLAALPVVLLLNYLGEWYGAFALVVVTVAAIWASDRTQELLGRTDPSEVVIDEVSGFLVTMLLLPTSWVNVGLGFILFRFFDIVKPWPVRQAERLKGGFGIVVDDLLAGVYAHLCLMGILLFAT